MAPSELRRRVDALEGAGVDVGGWGRMEAIWVVCEPGEGSEDAIARYQTEHGPRLPGQPAVVWTAVSTGVPRGEDSTCA